MKSLPANYECWITKKIIQKGGSISFYEYMNVVLNDPANGYYGSGKNILGPKGDFVTSPSMSEDFSFLLSKQVEEWLVQLRNKDFYNGKLFVMECGAGDGSLLSGLIQYFIFSNKDFLENISFIIIEPNRGMIKKQKRKLEKFINLGIEILWKSLEEFDNQSFNGIILANEVLDALPVERIVVEEGRLYRQVVSLDNKTGKLYFDKDSITKKLEKSLASAKTKLGIKVPPDDAPEGWATEWHVDNQIWLESLYKKINNGILLIIDYAKDAKRYYSSRNSNGTLISYKDQKVIHDVFESPGNCDLTSHICTETLINDAKNLGFENNGLVKQGEALLSLGLATRLFEVQNELKKDLSKALARREALLRLVDPICLGDFKWFIFSKFRNNKVKIKSSCLN